MNYSTAIFLINKDVRAIAVTYEKIDLSKNTTQMKYQPAYLSGGRLPSGAVVFKTMDPDIKVNDYVIVPTDTRHGMTVCQVVATDVEIDFDSEADVHWVIGTVDTVDFESLRQQEEQAIVAIKAAEKNKRRDELSQSLINNLGDYAPQIPMLNRDADGAPEETASEEKASK